MTLCLRYCGSGLQMIRECLLGNRRPHCYTGSCIVYELLSCLHQSVGAYIRDRKQLLVNLLQCIHTFLELNVVWGQLCLSKNLVRLQPSKIHGITYLLLCLTELLLDRVNRSLREGGDCRVEGSTRIYMVSTLIDCASVHYDWVLGLHTHLMFLPNAENLSMA